MENGKHNSIVLGSGVKIKNDYLTFETLRTSFSHPVGELFLLRKISLEGRLLVSAVQTHGFGATKNCMTA